MARRNEAFRRKGGDASAASAKGVKDPPIGMQVRPHSAERQQGYIKTRLLFCLQCSRLELDGMRMPLPMQIPGKCGPSGIIPMRDHQVRDTSCVRESHTIHYASKATPSPPRLPKHQYDNVLLLLQQAARPLF